MAITCILLQQWSGHWARIHFQTFQKQKLAVSSFHFSFLHLPILFSNSSNQRYKHRRCNRPTYILYMPSYQQILSNFIINCYLYGQDLRHKIFNWILWEICKLVWKYMEVLGVKSWVAPLSFLSRPIRSFNCLQILVLMLYLLTLRPGFQVDLGVQEGRDWGQNWLFPSKFLSICF